MLRRDEMLLKYKLAASEYLTMPKDIGFDFMEDVVTEMEEELGISWTEAYELFYDLTETV
jgi:hypothetical protein